MLATISIPATFTAVRESLAHHLLRLGYHLTDAELDDVARNVATAVVTLDADDKGEATAQEMSNR